MPGPVASGSQQTITNILNSAESDGVIQVVVSGSRQAITNIGWLEGTHSRGCVEVALYNEAVEMGSSGQAMDAILVRDSSDPYGPVLSFSRSQWSALLARIRTGHVDNSPSPEREASNERE